MVNIKIKNSHIKPLCDKHYTTDVQVTAEIDGENYTMTIQISGYAPNASERAKELGWEPDWGMDHTESELHLYLAQKINETLNKL